MSRGPEWSAVALLAASCTAGPSPTQIFLVVDSDLGVPEDIDLLRLDIEIEDEGLSVGPYDQYIDPAKRYSVTLPVSVGLRSSSHEDREIIVNVAAYRSRCSVDDEVVRRTARLHFVSHEVRVLCLHLEASCVGVVCTGEQTCIAGRCESVLVDSTMLALYSESDAAVAMCGIVALPDAGLDAGSLDADLGDADLIDADLIDAGPIDAGPTDAGASDASLPDASLPDSDAGPDFLPCDPP